MPVVVAKSAEPVSSTPAKAPLPVVVATSSPVRREASKATAKPMTTAEFMSSRKPAPVAEEAPKPAPVPVKPVEEKKTGVPVGADAKSEFLSEMIVVSDSGKTIRMTAYLMSKNLLAEGDFIGADQYAREWLENHPDDWRGWQLLGNIQVELKSFGKALNSFKKSLKLHPDNPTLRHYVDQAEGSGE